MKGKTIICRCEDVTLGDVQGAVARGYADIEEVKRFTGFGTGPCQGKECQSMVAKVLADLGERPSRPFTSRPPVCPAPLKFFAGDPLGED